MSDSLYPGADPVIREMVPERAVQSIALAEFRDRVYLAWCDAGNRVNVVSWNRRRERSQKVPLPYAGETGVSLAVFRDQLFMAWADVATRQLSLASSLDGIHWSTQPTSLHRKSDTRPALVVHGAQLVLGWTGRDSRHRLNLLFTGNGRRWGGKRTLGETAIGALALASFQRRLYIGWTGTDEEHHVNVACTTDGGASPLGKVTLDETSIAAPALFAFGDRLLLAWAESGSNGQLSLSTSSDGTAFAAKRSLGETSFVAPGLGICYGKPAICWPETTRKPQLNVLSV